MRVKARQNSGKGADCKEKVKQKKSAGNCKIYVKRQRSFGKENYYENGVKRRRNSGKAELCEDGVKRREKPGKTELCGDSVKQQQAAADGIRRETTASARGEAVKASECEKLATGSIRQEAPDRQPASACEQATRERRGGQ